MTANWTSRSLRAGRTLFAWLCAVYAAVWSGLVAQELFQWWRFPETLPSLGEPRTLLSMTTIMTILGAIFGAPAGLAAIATIRHFGWPRPLADIAFAALAAVSGAALFMALNLLNNVLASWSPISHDFVFTQAMYGLNLLGELGLMLVAGGAMGGAAYWLVAGRPAPPYA